MTEGQPTPESRRAAKLDRFGADSGDILKRLEGSPLILEGQVNLITLESVAERFGGRWREKRDAVYEHVARVLERNVGSGGYFARVTDTDFLIVHPSLGPFGAQAASYRAFGEIWRHFLGEGPQPDLAVHRVTELTKNYIHATPLSLADALAGEAQEAERASSRTVDNKSLLSFDRWSPFVASDGRKMRVSCTLQQVFNLQRRSRIGFRLRRRILDMNTGIPLAARDVAALGRADMLQIDMATIARGLGRLGIEAPHKAEQSLTIPVSYISIAHPGSRVIIAQALKLARKAVLTGVICEIYDAEDVAQASLLEAVSLIRPWSFLVAAYVRRPANQSMKDTGIQAISFSCPRNMANDAEFVAWAKPMIRASKFISPSVMIYRCASYRRLAIATQMGASHAAVE